jgi:HK97 family phage portal protein
MMNALRNLAYRAMKIVGISPRDPGSVSFFGYKDTASGVEVTPNMALTSSAIWAANRIISETLGSLPCLLYSISGTGKELAQDNSVFGLLADEPNPEMTPMSFFQTMQAHINMRGNCYAEIEINNAGEPIALWPLNPDYVQPIRRKDNGELGYLINDPNGGPPTPLARERMIHVPGLGFDGIVGYNVIHMARESIGLGIAAEKYGAKFFGSDARPSGILAAEGILSKKTKLEMKRTWEEAHKGLEKSHRIGILDRGIKWQQMTISPEEAQFLQTRKFHISEIARWFNMPNHMLRDLDRATFSNIEQQSLEFVTYTMRPWCRRWEQELKRKLFQKKDRRKFALCFALYDLLKTDIKTRYMAYHIALGDGFLNPDEVRAEEGRNPIPNGLGQTYRVAVNTMPIDEEPDEQPKPAGGLNDGNNPSAED